ncbi:MAG: hypothetical protein U0T69_06655 [Chitinophagales bacterium]
MKNKKFIILVIFIAIGLVFFITFLSSTNEKEKDFIICISSFGIGFSSLYFGIKEKFSLDFGSLKLRGIIAGIGMIIVGILYLIALLNQ